MKALTSSEVTSKTTYDGSISKRKKNAFIQKNTIILYHYSPSQTTRNDNSMYCLAWNLWKRASIYYKYNSEVKFFSFFMRNLNLVRSNVQGSSWFIQRSQISMWTSLNSTFKIYTTIFLFLSLRSFYFSSFLLQL